MYYSRFSRKKFSIFSFCWLQMSFFVSPSVPCAFVVCVFYSFLKAFIKTAPLSASPIKYIITKKSYGYIYDDNKRPPCSVFLPFCHNFHFPLYLRIFFAGCAYIMRKTSRYLVNSPSACPSVIEHITRGQFSMPTIDFFLLLCSITRITRVRNQFPFARAVCSFYSLYQIWNKPF